MSLPYLSAIFIATAAIALICLERLRPYDKRQKLFRRGWLMDLALYGLLQSWLLGLVIHALIRAMDRGTGLSRMHIVSSWPMGTQLVFFLLSHDLYIYVFHRLQHRFPALWRIHEAHHSAKQVDWISGARSHALEILINQTIEFAPIVLLGAAPEIAIWKGVIDSVWGMYIHANIDVRSGFLQKIFNGPEMHRWHHSRDVIDINFATKFAFWDFLFGTAYHPRRRKPVAYGLHGRDQQFPETFIAQQLEILRPRRALSTAAPVLSHK